MKRLSIGVLTALLAAGLGLNAVAARASATHGNIGTNALAQAGDQAPPPNFGSPPSGQIPILYNDHHVYSKPDVLKQDRVLAALVRGNTVLIPLRSMFEQMGATVSYDAATRTVDVSKAGADVKVTIGKPEVVINGETRPLDVPPIMYHGIVLVPVRVISEGMGAYVQWVPDRHIVVVRYLPATPPPPPPPPPTAMPPPPPPPPPPPAAYHDLYVAGDYIVSPKVYNEFSPGNSGNNNVGGFSYRIHGAAEFDLLGIPWMFEGDYRQINYPHNFGAVNVIGGGGSTLVPAFTARDYDLDTRLGIRVLSPRIYIGVGYMWRTNNYGYPRMNNWGFGISKLPDLDHPWSFYGSAWYYPNVKGNYGAFALSYNYLKYDIGFAYSILGTPIMLEGGWQGERGYPQDSAPIGTIQNGPYFGVGIKL
ncbi:MAG: copper amine oxidase N-terminal domain-containing protein [Candidatus Tyrphobacter sp.]